MRLSANGTVPEPEPPRSPSRGRWKRLSRGRSGGESGRYGARMDLDEPCVDTGGGRVRGAREDGICAFRGVPFAAAPVAARRFQPPQPAATWPGTLDARQYGPAPLQRVDPLSNQIGLDFPGPLDEDCLQLNVWTPATDDGGRPVMVWLHGGAFATGSGTSPAYAGHRIAARGDVVVVTLNYRVGALGFLHLAPLVPGVDGANLGLLDQLAALQWVRREIRSFGGDPDRVCLFGESAGAGSCVALLAMPAARGLFARVIVQSAAPDGMLTTEEGTARAQLFLDQLDLLDPGGATSGLARLQSVPTEQLLAAQAACIAAGPHRTGMFFAPVIGGESLPERPLHAIARGSARDVGVLIGSTAEEMQLYATVPGLGDFPDAILEQVVASRLDADAEERDVQAARAVALYRAELTPAPPAALSQRDLFFALETDLSLRVPATQLASRQAQLQPETFMYLFDWRSPMSDGHGGQLGACHALDLPFTFGCLSGGPALAFAAGDDPGMQQRARVLSDRLIDAWTAFARTGDPSHPGIGNWPRYDTPQRTTMLLGDTCRTCDAPLEERRAVWEGCFGSLPDLEPRPEPGPQG